MITADLEYYRPSALHEAIEICQRLSNQGKSPVYYSGGTEVITTLREGSLTAGAVIDLKEVPECRVLEIVEDRLVVGSAVTLNEVIDSNLFPLLGEVCRKFLDHTNRNKVTVGGNICSRLPYKETVLPFLVANSEALVEGPAGERRSPLSEAFHKAMNLSPGEILVQISARKDDLALPWAFHRATRLEKLAYPLASIAAVIGDGLPRVAISGVCDFPFRSQAIEQEIGDTRSPLGVRIDKAMTRLPAPARNDIDGSGEYRVVVAKNLLAGIVRQLEVG